MIKILTTDAECTAPVVHVTNPGWQTKFWYKAMPRPQRRPVVQEFDDPEIIKLITNTKSNS